jgi:hypothetical protein
MIADRIQLSTATIKSIFVTTRAGTRTGSVD